ncbi:Ubiquitin supergroup [Cynara cardunculus var. scolymus]|uniref:Ubiquitin supergroup n=1 Tax=Cynara cardunculus var. scolymus TaxID=59895 RepID=A0A103XZ50_CYNCS|nr:Ubiquitin supergroup [Cynara cardunculus var. scolymus]
MADDELVEVKFRLADGSDIGPSKYTSVTTVGSLKDKIISQWPKDKENGPKTINDVKLINAGKILENNKTLGESRSTVGITETTVLPFRPEDRDPTFTKVATEEERLFLHNPMKFIHTIRSFWIKSKES